MHNHRLYNSRAIGSRKPQQMSVLFARRREFLKGKGGKLCDFASGFRYRRGGSGGEKFAQRSVVIVDISDVISAVFCFRKCKRRLLTNCGFR